MTGDGPCLQALRTGTGRDPPEPGGGNWPAWVCRRGPGRGSADRDVDADSSQDQPVGATSTAAATACSPRSSDFLAVRFAERRRRGDAGGAVVRTRADHRGFAGRAASQNTIDQALGILMAQQRCDAEKAFGLLGTASQRRNIKLQVFAASVVTGIRGKAPASWLIERSHPFSGSEAVPNLG